MPRRPPAGHSASATGRRRSSAGSGRSWAGRAGDRAGGRGLAALSPREREVAVLVTERLTNREIAERLVLSPKTVERHLSRIYDALEISSRVELAREVERAR
jgi:DNA-binding NarL/FixJ family response regulator